MDPSGETFVCKSEDTGLCLTCLSGDRRVINYTNSSEHYKILKEYIGNKLPEFEVNMCWECSAIVRRIILFRRQCLEAIEAMTYLDQNNIFLIKPLSKLTVSKDESYSLIIYERPPDFDVDMKDFGSDYEDVVDQVAEDDLKPEIVSLKQEIEAQNENVRSTRSRTAKKQDRPKKCKVRKKRKKKSTWTSDDETTLVKVKKEKSDMPPDLGKVKERFPGKFKSIYLSEEEMLEMRKLEIQRESYLARPYRCDSCIKTYMNESELIKHNEALHIERKNCIQCNICLQYIAEKGMTLHKRVHYIAYECLVCNEKCYKLASYHYKTQHDNRVHICKLCGEEFIHFRALKHHREKTHRGTFPCEYCGKVFNVKGTYKVHLLIHTDTSQAECPICKKLIKNHYYLRRHIRLTHPTDTNPNAYCAECDKHFKNIHEYRSHIKYTDKHITVKNLYSCTHCDKRFSTKINVKRHIDRVHLKRYHEACQHCGKVFASGKHLNEHIARVHEGVEPVRDKICDHCGKAFYCQKILEQHTRKHTGERPFVCNLCNQTFTYSGAFYTHNKLVHKIKKANTRRRASLTIDTVPQQQPLLINNDAQA